jgi:dipeptidyl aminopeptidase/acylaminoacyl peptidase
MSRIVILTLVVTLVAGQVGATSLRPLTVEDCVRTRRIVDQEVSLSRDGSQVAYVVKAPDTATNRNDYELYVRDLTRLGVRENGRMLVQADGISELHWLGSGRLMARVDRQTQNKETESHICTVDTATGTLETLDLPGTIEEYSASADGDKIVFSIKAPAEESASAAEEEKVREDRGYPMVFGGALWDSPEGLSQDEMFLATRKSKGNYDVKRLSFSDSSVRARSSLRSVRELNLSPDGKYLLFTYSSGSLPGEWEREPYFKLLKGFGTSSYSYVLGLYEIDTGELRLGFNSPGVFLHTKWSDDSRFYSVVGPSPFGTAEAQKEVAWARATGDLEQNIGRFQHVFLVDPKTQVTTKVIEREGNDLWVDLPLSWEHGDGAMLVRTDASTLTWMARKDGDWKQDSHLSFSNDQSYPSSLESDGKVLVGVYQTTMVPPDLFLFDLGTRKWQLLTDLNPEYRGIELGQVERISWTNRYGSKCWGLLIKPVGYEPRKRYPMVLLSAPSSNVFISDALYTTSYAPQSLANAGFVVVMSRYPLDNRIPPGRFPGRMSSAYNWMAMAESAVDLLVRRGIADPNNVGIAGFSRTAWLTDFALTHSSYHFTAASSADSGIYTYGAYFRYNSQAAITGAETQVGGPPYGETLRDWLKYAAPFNADKVRTPILMEYIHTADHGLEFFTALSRMGKAVEFYRYPKGAHPLDTPFERVASLERNVDWFRFWMQGYEGTAPDYDLGQYDRWRALRLRVSAAKSLLTRSSGGP